MSAGDTMDTYLEESATWDADRIALKDRDVRMAWRVATIALVLLLLCIVALILLLPLKRVQAFLVRVDGSTGVVDVVPEFVGKAPMPEVVTRYLLDHYVTVCERFNFVTAESDYEECGAFHGPTRNQAWLTYWDRSNPQSPLNLYKDSSSIRAQVSSVSFFERGNGVQDLAQIRYTKSKRTGSGGGEQVSHWITNIQYAYAEPSKNPRLRRWNPLGFKVLAFQAEPETLPTGAGPVQGAGL